MLQVKKSRLCIRLKETKVLFLILVISRMKNDRRKIPFYFQEFEIDPDLIKEQKAEVESKVSTYLIIFLFLQTEFSCR